MYRLLAPIGLALLLFALPSGCQEVRKKAGLKTEVCTAPADTADGVVLALMKSALIEDEEESWEAFRELLHSREVDSPASESAWRTMKYPSFRRKIRLYLEDDTSPCFQFRYSEDIMSGGMKYFVQNEGNPDLPSPVKLAPDPEAGGALRITLIP